MPKYIRKTLPNDEALGFIQNMRWFAGIGRVSWKPAKPGFTSVRASRSAWSMWK